jgi:hypothetical protein
MVPADSGPATPRSPDGERVAMDVNVVVRGLQKEHWAGHSSSGGPVELFLFAIDP